MFSGLLLQPSAGLSLAPRLSLGIAPLALSVLGFRSLPIGLFDLPFDRLIYLFYGLHFLCVPSRGRRADGLRGLSRFV